MQPPPTANPLFAVEHQHRLMDSEWLKAGSTQAVLAALSADGHTARVVGGAVRDALLGRAVRDIDIATNATPVDVLALAAAANLKALPTGLEHGTVTVIANDRSYQVTTLRRDVETDGRHAKVAFTTDWAADASRRDFTINALYCDADGTLFDPLAAHADLTAGRVRFVGDASQRIAEDSLRILRFFRFSAEYAAGTPDGSGLAACVAGRAGLGQLSAERVRDELLKLLAASGAAAVVRVMYEHGLIQAVLGAAPQLRLFEPLVAIETGLRLEPDSALRLCALAVAVDEDVDRMSERFKLSNNERGVLAANIWRDVARLRSIDTAQARRELYFRGNAGMRAAVTMAWAASGKPIDDQRWRVLLEMAVGGVPPRFPIAGKDVLALGIAPGPQVGGLLRELEDWWIASGFSDDRNLIEQRLSTIAKRAKQQ